MNECQPFTKEEPISASVGEIFELMNASLKEETPFDDTDEQTRIKQIEMFLGGTGNFVYLLSKMQEKSDFREKLNEKLNEVRNSNLNELLTSLVNLYKHLRYNKEVKLMHAVEYVICIALGLPDYFYRTIGRTDMRVNLIEKASNLKKNFGLVSKTQYVQDIAFFVKDVLIFFGLSQTLLQLNLLWYVNSYVLTAKNVYYWINAIGENRSLKAEKLAKSSKNKLNLLRFIENDHWMLLSKLQSIQGFKETRGKKSVTIKGKVTSLIIVETEDQVRLLAQLGFVELVKGENSYLLGFAVKGLSEIVFVDSQQPSVVVGDNIKYRTIKSKTDTFYYLTKEDKPNKELQSSIPLVNKVVRRSAFDLINNEFCTLISKIKENEELMCNEWLKISNNSQETCNRDIKATRLFKDEVDKYYDFIDDLVNLDVSNKILKAIQEIDDEIFFDEGFAFSPTTQDERTELINNILTEEKEPMKVKELNLSENFGLLFKDEAFVMNQHFNIYRNTLIVNHFFKFEPRIGDYFETKVENNELKLKLVQGGLESFTEGDTIVVQFIVENGEDKGLKAEKMLKYFAHGWRPLEVNGDFKVRLASGKTKVTMRVWKKNETEKQLEAFIDGC